MNTTDTTKYKQPEPHTEFWVGQAEGVQYRMPLVGETRPVFPTNNSTIDMSKIIIGAKTAVRFDDGKALWSLVPFEALEGMAEVLAFGAKKYSAWNWAEGGGFSYSRVLGSCLRHIFAFMRGEDTDPESGLSHISHAQCNLMFLAYYIRDKKKFNKDDRNVR